MSLVNDDVLPLESSEHRRVLHRDLVRGDHDRESRLGVLNGLLEVQSVSLLLLCDELDGRSLSEGSSVTWLVRWVGKSSPSDLLSFHRGSVVL